MNGEIAKLIYNQELEMKNGLIVLQSCVFDQALTIEESRRIRNFGPYIFRMHWKTIHPETVFFPNGQTCATKNNNNMVKTSPSW